ncbi:hypothetical protein PPERSA_06499 [Pseudocohnilembus persalinus]|uniref:Transmembrane protein n=1 Tax=Pseudocohnilembus persalinus TaxID=266149 RepID=A0A0V0QRP2_PSEPJ|nr:hypothetical protein PPERSA_06499 [Pseudocohnilembus persalinus]|eukprot:KRX04865.1 hypothetical protein PPERSA_06499 [Pseudocohnilembus persalinus]
MFNQLRNQQKSQQLAPIQNPPHQQYQNQDKFGGPRLGQQFGNMYQKVDENDQDYQNPDRNVKLQMLQKQSADIKKNIANGQVKDIDIDNAIELKGNEKIQDLNDDNLEYLIQLHLKQKPERKMNFLENLKDGTFVKISDAVLREKERQGEEEQYSKQEVVDQFSQDLYSLIKGSNVRYNIMYSIILFSGDTDYNKEYQATNGLRLNQLLYIFGAISFVGSYHLFKQADLQEDFDDNSDNDVEII